MCVALPHVPVFEAVRDAGYVLGDLHTLDEGVPVWDRFSEREGCCLFKLIIVEGGFQDALTGRRGNDDLGGYLVASLLRLQDSLRWRFNQHILYLVSWCGRSLP